MSRLVLIAILVITLCNGCAKKQEPASPFTYAEIFIKNFNFDNEPSIGNTYTFYASRDTGSQQYVIQNTDSLPVGTDITKLKAQFTLLNDKIQVTINDKPQVSGATENNFADPVIYHASSSEGTVQEIKVIVNVARAVHEPAQYIMVNGDLHDAAFKDIATRFGKQMNKKVGVGVGVIVSYLNNTPENCLSQLNSYLNLAGKYDLPILIKLDGEQWWEYRLDLWNWWDPGKPGYDPDNRMNVEWYDWTPGAAVKIGWRNWGSQIRVNPMPNLMSPAYRNACHEELTKMVNAIKAWKDTLPTNKKFLFLGIVIGWESAIGVNNYFYPDGNSYLMMPGSSDPTGGPAGPPPARGLQTIGYAAVKTSGIASSGILTESMQAEVIYRHLEDLSKVVYDLGIERDKIFTHCGGWYPGEALYKSALNAYSCPGWSFYNYADDPQKDMGVMSALELNEAPYWAASEWLLPGSKTQQEWLSAFQKTLGANPRFLCIYNWPDIASNADAINALMQMNQ